MWARRAEFCAQHRQPLSLLELREDMNEQLPTLDTQDHCILHREPPADVQDPSAS